MLEEAHFLSQVGYNPSIFYAALDMSVSGLEISGSEQQAEEGTLQSQGAKLDRLSPLSVAKKSQEL